nr:hypothetical protein [Desulfuromonas sp.]
MNFERKKIGEILVEMGALTPAEVKLVLERMPATGNRFGETAIGEGLIGEDLLVQVLGRQFQLECLDTRSFILNPELMASLPAGLPMQYRFLPVERRADGLVIAVADPTDVAGLDNL